MDDEIVRSDGQYEYIYQEILKWIQDSNIEPKLVENAVRYIGEVKDGRALNRLETTCVESQYFKALVKKWETSCLEKAFHHVWNQPTDISTELPIIVEEVNSIDSFKDITTKLNAKKSQLRIWFDGGCPYFRLILKQEDVFKNTPRFALRLNHSFKKLKSCFVNLVFSRCKNDIVNDATDCKESCKDLQQFLSALTDFLTKANEDKVLQDILKDYMVKNYITTINSEEVWQRWVNSLIDKILNVAKSDNEANSIPEWIQRFKSAALSLEKWTPKLKCLIRETCKNFVLPETTIEMREEYGRKMIFINGVAIFVSKFMGKMEELRANDEKVEEIQIVGQSSIHIDCDLENEFWHGINVDLVTDKLIICANENGQKRVWDVSGRHAQIIESKGRRLHHSKKMGESGGSVRTKCNELIGAERWMVECNGGNGDSARQWSLEEFKAIINPILPALITDEKKEDCDQPTIKDLYKRLVCSLDEDYRSKATYIVRDNHQNDDRMTRSGRLADGSRVTLSLYESKKTNKNRHTLILIKGSVLGQSGYGGDVILELSNKEHAVPPIGMDVYQSMAARGIVYKASGKDGKKGQAFGDIGFIHNGDAIQPENYIGFDRHQTLEIQYYSNKKEAQEDTVASYVKVIDDLGNRRYARIISPTRAPTCRSSKEATKKNAVIRQSLVRHFSKINELKQMKESLWKMMLSGSLEENQNFDQWISEIESSEVQFDQLVHQQWNQEKIQCLKTSPEIKSRVARHSSVCQEEFSNVPILNKDNMETRRKLERFLIDNKEKFKPGTWRKMSHLSISESRGKIEKLDDQIIFIFSYLNFKRKPLVVERIPKKWMKQLVIGERVDDLQSLAVFLHDFECAVQRLGKPKKTIQPKEIKIFQLRETQILAIVTLLFTIGANDRSYCQNLVEVSTGEGKSLIVAAVAIALAINSRMKYRIDVITTNDLLALRDSNLSVAKGGLKNLYEYFGVSVTNNCSQSEDDRKASYAAQVVYGQLANFQRDYLLDKFYGHNIRGNREFLYAIIDEVDCMLLDRSSNTLYLSHDIPGMETLESLYVYIWERIRNSTIDTNNSEKKMKKLIKSEVLFDLYGVTIQDDLKSVHNPLTDSEKQEIWNHLIDEKVIDSKGRLLIEDCNKITEEAIKYSPAEFCGENMNAKLVFHFRKVANRQRRIRIPAHLLDFVDRNLDTWLDSGFQALQLKPDEHYVVDQDRTDINLDLNSQVIIIDPYTGTDETSSQWDGALHQFVQLKEGCKLTLQSLKAVFISNAMYIKMYRNRIVGVSGTLGSEQEQIFLQDTFKCHLYRIPSAVPKRFKQTPAQVHSTEEEWLNAITSETNAIIEGGRSILIFCKSIKNANIIHQRLKSSNPTLNEKIHIYTRDYGKFAFESTQLDIGHVIVATNLAGRGTDIKISRNLRANGGLHVCLTFFADSERIEEQAMGRAARNGAPGSGILILCKSISGEDKMLQDDQNLIAIMKNKRNIEEIQRIKRLAQDFKDMEDQMKLFDQFTEYDVKLKNELKKYGDPESSAICGSVLDQWALWLDEMNSLTSDVIRYSYSTQFISKFKAVMEKSFDVRKMDWMTPARLVVIAKYWATRNKKPNYLMAIKILDQLIQSKDNQFYPTAYYYRAFILLKENYETNKNEFIKTLRQCENVLKDHINMQISFFTIAQTMESRKTGDQPLSFCVVDGYTQQKDNTINLLQYFVGSVRSLMGTDCSIEDFAAAGSMPENVKNYFQRNLINFEKWLDKKTEFKVFQKKEENKDPNESKISFEKVEEYFRLLLAGESKCIGHQLNSPSTIPNWNSAAVEQDAKSNRDMAIERVAIANGISASTLEKAIQQAVRKDLSKEDIEQELENEIKMKFKKDNLIHCTRESFWAKLVETGVLFNNENVFTVEDCNLESLNLNRNEAITFKFYDKNQVVYNPIRVISKNGRKEEIIFRQTYVEDTLRKDSRNEDRLHSNKIAKLDFVKLKSVDLKLFGQLTDDDLRRAEISPDERKGIMDELKKQDIIDDEGNLSSNYDGQQFQYPNCPAYEDTVMYLVANKFRAEIVRRYWLNCKDDSNHLNAIKILPLTPYQDILDDLIAAHVISDGLRVKNMDEDALKRRVTEITQEDHETECILDFLKSRQAIYETTWLTHKKAELDFMDSDIRKVKGNTFESELYLFRLIGFDQFMYMKDFQKSTKQMVLTSLSGSTIIIGGLASISAGAWLTFFSKILPFRVAKDLLFMGGLSDIIYVMKSLLSNNKISFSDFAHQRIKSATGEMNLVDEGKTLWKLCKYVESADQNYRPAVRIHTDIFHHRRVREADDKGTQREIVNALGETGVGWDRG